MTIETEDFDPTSAFLTNMGVEADPSEVEDEPRREEPEGEPDEGTETAQGEGTEGGEETEGESEGEGGETPAEDPEVELKIGDKTEKVKLSDLTKLYEDKAKLEATGQETAAQRQKAEVEYTRASTALQRMLEKANDRLKPYSELNYFLLAQRMDPQSFEQLQKDAQAAYADVQFLQTELDGLVQTRQQEAHATNHQAVQASIQTLSDPKTGIPDFGKKVYNEIVDYAVSQGIPKDAALGVIDPGAIKMMHKAMLYDRGVQNVQKQAKPAVNASPKRAMRPSGTGNASSNKTSQQKAIERMASSGDPDDVTNAFFANLLGE